VTRPTRAALLASAPLSVQRRNAPPAAPVAPPAPAKRPGRGSARPATPDARTGALDAAAGVVVVELPGLRLASEANARAGAHWARTKRTEAARSAVARAMPRALPPLPLRVCITRRAPGTLDDDNAASAAKATRDSVAAALGVDDADPRVVWRVAQERTKRGVYGVRVTLAPIDGRGSVVAEERADVVRLALTRDQAGDVVQGLLSRAGGFARVECGGVVIEMSVREAR